MESTQKPDHDAVAPHTPSAAESTIYTPPSVSTTVGKDVNTTQAAPGQAAPVVAPPPPPVVAAIPKVKPINPAGKMGEPHTREQFLYAVFADATKKLMICLAPRSTLFPFQDAILKSPGMVHALSMNKKSREALVKDTSYTRVLFTRNPSTRLYSVYLNKFYNRDKTSSDYKIFMEHLMGQAWVKANNIVELPRPSFMDFLEQIEANGFDGDEVWDPVHRICGMDQMKYDITFHTEDYVNNAGRFLATLGYKKTPSAVMNVTEISRETLGIGNELTAPVLKKLSKLYLRDYMDHGYTVAGKDFLRLPPPKTGNQVLSSLLKR